MPKIKDSIKLIGDRLLIKPAEEKITKSGIVIPDTADENKSVAKGTVVQVGPGFLNPSHDKSSMEDWVSSSTPKAEHVPLQVKPTHEVVYVKQAAIEIMIDSEEYHVIPQSAVLIYDEDPFELNTLS